MINIPVIEDPRLTVFVASLLPSVEARYALILGLALGLSLIDAMIYSTLGVLVLSLALAAAIEWLDKLLTGWASASGLRAFSGRLYIKLRESAAERAGPYIEKWGAIGLTLFIAVPLPVTGMYTGSLAALILGVRGPKLILALMLGGLASLLIVVAGSAVAQRAFPG